MTALDGVWAYLLLSVGASVGAALMAYLGRKGKLEALNLIRAFLQVTQAHNKDPQLAQVRKAAEEWLRGA